MSDLASRVLASMRCGVVTVDHAGRVTSVNSLAGEWLRVDPAATRGRDCREVFSHCPAIAHLLLDALGRASLPDRAELEIAFELERRTLIGFSLSRIPGDGGETVGSAIFFKDLTVVEEERERQALRNRLASLGETAAQLAHEIRNRLGGIRLFLGLAKRRLAGDPEGEAYVERAESEILEANAKMGQILDFVRPLKLDLSRADPEALCREALEATLARFPGGPPKVEWIAHEDLPQVIVDPGRVRDALANLFANGVEAIADAGTLRVRLSREDAPVLVASPLGKEVPGLRGYGEGRGCRVRIEIGDDGPGMPPEVLRRIFHPFFTTKVHGSGLGVSAAQKILDAHGGSLDARSEPGRGTTFIVLLPSAGPEE
ncbi:MAG: ATP-binding protein [Deferrisomatales bacterium]|nr:ATP-binding protein [Deferrisomatales bacterium]